MYFCCFRTWTTICWVRNSCITIFFTQNYNHCSLLSSTQKYWGKAYGQPKTSPFVTWFNLWICAIFFLHGRKRIFAWLGYVLVYNSFVKFPWNSLIYLPNHFSAQVISRWVCEYYFCSFDGNDCKYLLAVPSFPSSLISHQGEGNTLLSLGPYSLFILYFHLRPLCWGPWLPCSLLWTRASHCPGTVTQILKVATAASGEALPSPASSPTTYLPCTLHTSHAASS